MINFTAQPKIELHLHLDCSLSYSVVQTLDPSITETQYKNEFVASVNCRDLNDYIAKAGRAIDLMQSREALRLVTLDLFDQLKNDNVIYAELRFAPLEHTKKGLTPQQVVEAVEKATQEGIQRTGIEAGVILCTLRHYSEEESLETVNLCSDFNNTRIVGFDIAADEAGYPVDNHVKAFEYARRYSIPCTAHAGEACGAESVWETLQEFKPSRIGHGVRSVEDPKLMEHLKKKQIHLEVCPTSNTYTKVVSRLEDHPVDRIYNSGVSMSINTDGRTISNVSLRDEYESLHEIFDWTKEHLLTCNLEAIEHAFIDEKMKEKLRFKLLDGWK
ncbi:adenosine deaminase [Rhodohalobacter barkolensis]|uniref:adenosine deaminase n=1 Tax=Rhodohalobacter barkolensis TaxID=2053187 RepID=A0A2N0VKZ5_9BACT|nr:adenosine deaminase [Rhodohalobacter barkolensis]PKD44873.1 adenosine deaminase [Rhodohalobacter barkolensis]